MRGQDRSEAGRVGWPLACRWRRWWWTWLPPRTGAKTEACGRTGGHFTNASFEVWVNMGNGENWQMDANWIETSRVLVLDDEQNITGALWTGWDGARSNAVAMVRLCASGSYKNINYNSQRLVVRVCYLASSAFQTRKLHTV